MNDEIIRRLQLIPTESHIGASFVNNITIYLSKKYNVYFMACDFMGNPLRWHVYRVFNKKGFLDITEEFLVNCEEYIILATLTKI